MDHKEFFEEYEDWNIFMIYDNAKRKQLAFGVEELYQAFKARLMDEVEAQHKIIHYTDPDGNQDIEIFRSELKNKVSKE